MNLGALEGKRGQITDSRVGIRAVHSWTGHGTLNRPADEQPHSRRHRFRMSGWVRARPRRSAQRTPHGTADSTAQRSNQPPTAPPHPEQPRARIDLRQPLVELHRQSGSQPSPQPTSPVAAMRSTINRSPSGLAIGRLSELLRGHAQLTLPRHRSFRRRSRVRS